MSILLHDEQPGDCKTGWLFVILHRLEFISLRKARAATAGGQSGQREHVRCAVRLEKDRREKRWERDRRVRFADRSREGRHGWRGARAARSLTTSIRGYRLQRLASPAALTARART